MATLTQKQVKLANWLLRHSRGKPEDFIRKRIGDLLGTLEIEYEISYPTDGGPADIYLPRRRTIIETKASGLANYPDRPQARRNEETPRQQLERYLRAEIAYERGCLQLEGESDRPWIGVVTDGRVWHVWRYPHDDNPVGTTMEKGGFRPTRAEALIERLRYYIEGEPVGKPWIPSDPRELFEPRLEELRRLHAELPTRIMLRTETKKRLWLEMLVTTSMAPESEPARQRLFVAHSFLVAFARGVTHVLARPNEQPRAEDILSDGFIAWIVATAKGCQWANHFLKEIYSYEWRRRPGDVLRPLYEAFVDERDRKAFGEFYTPDWLADLLVQQVCDDEWCETAVREALSANRKGAEVKGVGVLDPTCGSGTFLYYAARRILACPGVKSLTNSDKAAVVCALVHGIDVHPVAAEISRATLLRALPTEPPQGKANLGIHEGDALMLRADDQGSLFRADDNRIRITTPKGNEVFLPRGFVDNAHFGDNLRRLVLSAQSEETLPKDILEGLSTADRKAVKECHRLFVEIIKTEGNSVWTWYIINTTGPYRLSERKVDRIVANPPWVTMAGIQVQERKRALENFANHKDIGLWMGGKQAPHFDIAQLFVKRTRRLYLASPESDPAAWLVKKAALKAGSWEKFRAWHERICAQTVDLEAIKPFGGGDARRCCVLFENRTSSLEQKSPRYIVGQIQGTTPIPQASFEEIRGRLSFKATPPAIVRDVSGYVDRGQAPVFRQGATVTPKVLTIVDGEVEENNRERTVWTAPSQHPPWSALDPQSGTVPETWVRSLIVSKAVIPYAVASHALLRAVIPVDHIGRLERCPEGRSGFWRGIDEIYRQYRGEGSNTPKTLLARIDYGGQLSAQLALRKSSRKMVLYPSSGDIMRACRICPGEAIVDSTLYRYVARSAQEAAYLVGLMNADCLTEAFSQSRSSGRHFHLHPWRAIPIPKFDRTKPDHVALARLGERAERLVESWLSGFETQPPRLGQVALSTRARELLRDDGISDQIDVVVRRILPKQAQ